MSGPEIILASNSPRRKELLEKARIPFTVEPADVDETQHDGEPAGDYASRLALDKARAVASRHEGGLVIGADTVVVIDGETLGKPADAKDARRTLRRLSGRAHVVMTGVAVVDAATGRELSAVESTEVCFRTLSDDEIDAYVATGEPMDKAGSYGIQERASVFVEGIDGCFFNVVGLPVSRIWAMVSELCKCSPAQYSE